TARRPPPPATRPCAPNDPPPSPTPPSPCARPLSLPGTEGDGAPGPRKHPRAARRQSLPSAHHRDTQSSQLSPIEHRLARRCDHFDGCGPDHTRESAEKVAESTYDGDILRQDRPWLLAPRRGCQLI